MASTLVLPAGVRLLRWEELGGPEAERAAMWARIQAAHITPGFVLRASGDARFSLYAEVNVDAPRLWDVFSDLCRGVLGPVTTLVMSEVDADPEPLGSARTAAILDHLTRYAYRLANDGCLQFGMVDDRGDAVTEVFVAATKHLQLWVCDGQRLLSILTRHGLAEAPQLEFLDEYPRATIPLPEDNGALPDHTRLIAHLRERVRALSSH